MRLLVVGDFQGKFSERTRKQIEKEEFDMVIGVGDYTGIDEWRPFIQHCFKCNKLGKEPKSPQEFFGKKGFRYLLKKDDELARKVLRTLNQFGKPVIFVFGNGDDGWYNYPFIAKTRKKYSLQVKKKNSNFLKSLNNFIDVNYRTRKWNGINFIGFGGYMDIDAYVEDEEFVENDGPEMVAKRKKRMRKSRELMFKLCKKEKGKKIFVLHYPPKGVFDIIRDKKNLMNGKSAGIRAFREAIVNFKPKLVLCGHMHEYQGMKKIGESLIVNPGDTGEGKYAIVDVADDLKGKIRVKFR